MMNEPVMTPSGLNNSGSIDLKAAEMTANLNRYGRYNEYLDCSEIAADINNAVSGGHIFEMTPKSGRLFNGIEYGENVKFSYHQFFAKDNMVYDPMFGDKPVSYDSFINEYKKLNPNGLI